MTDKSRAPTMPSLSQLSKPTNKPETVVKVDENLLKNKLGESTQTPNHTQQPADNAPKTDHAPTKLIPPVSEFKNVDIVISGTTHRINAPVNLIDTLNHTADKLNDNLKQIRKNVRGKSPTNEELLVLHCLDLYDTIAELEKSLAAAAVTDRTASQALDKVIQSIRAIGQ